MSPRNNRPPDTALEALKRKQRNRDLTANVVTVLMLLLTLAMLGYVAYQLNNPVTIYLSRIFGGR